MSTLTATSVANPNIAFIKYWGNLDNRLIIPQNGSISMNLDGLFTTTTVTFDHSLPDDSLILNGQPANRAALVRVSEFLNIIRQMAGIRASAHVVSDNNFPTGAGIASSASAFAALSLAGTQAAGLHLHTIELSRLARRGSGSACRSVPGGYVEWLPGEGDQDSYAVTIASADHWDLVDCIAVLHTGHKPVGSTEGHTLANTSPLQAARVESVKVNLKQCRKAILERDFEKFADIVEKDSNLMHAVMITSTPPLLYWEAASIEIMKAVIEWRKGGLPVCYTLDAGPNVHVLCESVFADEVKRRLQEAPGVTSVLTARPGGAAYCLS